MAGPIVGMLGKAIGAMLASQVGSGVGRPGGRGAQRLRRRTPARHAGQGRARDGRTSRTSPPGLDVGEDDASCCTSPSARRPTSGSSRMCRGCASTCSARSADYANGIEVNSANLQSSMEEKMRGIDMNNPDSMRERMEGGMFEMEKSPAQQAALEGSR